jgi:hypothetical protein
MSSKTDRTDTTADTSSGRTRDNAVSGAKRPGDGSTPSRNKASDVRQTAPETAGNEGQTRPPAADRAADAISQRVAGAASYVRDHDPSEVVDDAVRAAEEYPVAALLILTGVVIGGSLLAAHMLRPGETTKADASRARSVFAAASGSLGSQTSQTVTRIRDAVISMALMKAVDAIAEKFPEFRGHFEKA